MREFNFNIPKTGLKNTNTATGGLLQLKNLKPEDGYWSVPKALDMTLGEGQLLRGRGVTLLWKEGEEGEEPELPELPEGAIGISTIEQLQLIGNDVDYPLDGYYVLTQDIDASATVTWNDGAGFAPIGSYDTPFIGTLDGQGYGVTDLYINRPDENYAGLFGYVSAGGTITNCYATCAVTGYYYAGGLVGVVGYGGTVTNCYATGAVTSIGEYNAVGGLVGFLGGGTVTNCYATGAVTGDYAGGLVGVNEGTVTNCYATCAVTGDVDVGGLVGVVGYGGTVTNCYATGAVTGEANVGGLVGYNDGTVTASYYDTQTTGQADNTGKGEPKTTAQMKLQATFVDWDFVDVWEIAAGAYPTLQALAEEEEPVHDPTPDGFYTVNETDLSLTRLFNTPMSGRWQMADWGPFYILADGATTWSITEGVATEADVRIGAVCARDGRLFYGDVDATPNLVGWSMLDGEDILDTLSGTTPDAVSLSMNEDAQAPMPFRGQVHALLPLGDGIIVYGADGIVALGPALGLVGFRDIQGLPAHLGVAGRAAVDGNLLQHVFIGSDGALWTITADLKAQRLDYAWALTGLDQVVFDGEESEFWITDGATDSFVLTATGLGGPIDQCPTSLARIGDTVYATGIPYAAETVKVALKTNTFDMGQNGQKRVSNVNVSGEISDATVGLQYKYTTSDTFQERAAVMCSPEGAAFLNTALVYGQAELEATCAPGSRITKIEVRYQSHDRRFVRGTRGFQNSPDGEGSEDAGA